MTKIMFIMTCAAMVALAMTANTGVSKDLPSGGTITANPYQDSSSNEDIDIDTQAIMNACNETFRIEMSYLESLNESGSFTDETDKTPKCYIRCLLENMGILSESGGMFDPARAAILFAGERNGKQMEDIGDMTASCAADRQETCRCEKAYMFMRCLMSMEIEKYEQSQ